MLLMMPAIKEMPPRDILCDSRYTFSACGGEENLEHMKNVYFSSRGSVFEKINDKYYMHPCGMSLMSIVCTESHISCAQLATIF